MLTALQTNPSSSVFALHSSNSASSSTQRDQADQNHLDDITRCRMDKSSPSSSSSTTTNNYQGLTPQLIPMATVPPPHVLIGPGGGYTILPSITSLNSADATFGNLTSLHPIAGGFAQASTNPGGTTASPITAIQATYYPNSHHPSAPTPTEGGATTSGGEMYRNSVSAATTSATSSAAAILQPTIQTAHSHSGTGQTQLIQNGNQTVTIAAHNVQTSPDTKPSMSSLLLQQQQLHPQANNHPPPLCVSRVVSNGVLTSSSSDPSLHHSSSGSSSSGSSGSGGDRLLEPATEYGTGFAGDSRRASHDVVVHHGGGAAAAMEVEVKREPEEGASIVQSCGRRHSDSNNSVDASSATNISTTTASKNSPYPVSALIDVPMITPLNRSSRTSSLSSSLSSFRFGGSLSQLWASQISLSGKIPNMKSTG